MEGCHLIGLSPAVLLRSPSGHMPQFQGPQVQDVGMRLLHEAFQGFNEVVSSSESCSEVGRKKLQDMEEQWQSRGIHGRSAVAMLAHYKQQIAWEVDVALDAWRLILDRRFRLLDKWCEYVTSRQGTMRVFNEDQWRQVLDFSRTVHEDLSNYDVNGAWAWVLDEFVEYIRMQRGSHRYQAMDAEVPSLSQDNIASVLPVSPRCGSMVAMHRLRWETLTDCIDGGNVGSKRRSPDIDTVAEKLSNMPLESAGSDDISGMGLLSLAKRACLDQPVPPHPRGSTQLELPDVMWDVQSFLLRKVCTCLPTPTTSPIYPACTDCQMLMPMSSNGMLNLPSRRTVRTRRSGVSELVSSTVSDALGFTE